MSNQKNISIFEKLIEDTVGLSISEIKDLSSDEICNHIEKTRKVKLKLGKKDTGVMYRGNMLLALENINYDIDADFDKIFGTNA